MARPEAGQAGRARDEAGHPNSQVVILPRDEGADSHAIGTNLSLMSQVVFDWLDEVLAEVRKSQKRPAGALAPAAAGER